MEYLHRCVFCGASRVAGSATILPPHCERCGCLLVSEPKGARETVLAPVAPGRHRPLGRALGLAASFAVMFAAMAAGYDIAGVWVAVVAFAAAGLAMLPFLAPEG